MKYVYAGDRDISVQVLEVLRKKGLDPEMLMVVEPEKASHSYELKSCSGLPDSKIAEGKDFLNIAFIEQCKSINPDYIIGVHFPYLIPESLLEIPKHGFLNLHPSYLPYNRGWNTPSWAILENTPVGATLHCMAKKIDTGDIIHQKRVKVSPEDTAHTLYGKIKESELALFEDVLPDMINLNLKKVPQNLSIGTTHKKGDLQSAAVQEIELSEFYKAEEIIDKIRALTTDRLSEAAYFIKEEKKYLIQIKITPEVYND